MKLVRRVVFIFLMLFVAWNVYLWNEVARYEEKFTRVTGVKEVLDLFIYEGKATAELLLENGRIIDTGFATARSYKDYLFNKREVFNEESKSFRLGRVDGVGSNCAHYIVRKYGEQFGIPEKDLNLTLKRAVKYSDNIYKLLNDWPFDNEIDNFPDYCWVEKNGVRYKN